MKKDSKMTPESREKMRAAFWRRFNAGKHNRRGKKHTAESRIKMSETLRAVMPKGPNCPAYKDGKHAERQGFRQSAEYKQWRFDVYSRDRFTCQIFGDAKGGNLNAHHIFHYATHPELRTNLDNGITICLPCHERFHHKPESIRNRVKARSLIGLGLRLPGRRRTIIRTHQP